MFRFHGNYCGPGWSAGKYQSSVVSDVESVDELDQACKVHDASYAMGEDLMMADRKFINDVPKTDVKGLIAAGMVGAQYVGRVLKNHFQSPSMQRKNLRGSLPNVPKLPNNSQSLGGEQVSAPAAISNVLTAQKTRTRSIKDGIHVSGREFLSTVEGQGVSAFGLGKCFPLAPAYFYGGVLGQLCRSYQYYRWRKLCVHYIPKVSTATTGEIIICSNENVVEPALSGESTTFLQRAIVSGNGVMAPLWIPVKMEISTDDVWRFIDPANNVDINETIFAELQAYTQIGVAAQPGYLWLEYECELKIPMLQPHSTSMPLLMGGARVTLTDNAATNTAPAPVALTQTSGTDFTTLGFGAIYKLTIDLQGCTAGTGATLANAWKVQTLTAGSGLTTAGTIVVQTFGNLTIVGGLTVYVAWNAATNLSVYTTIEAAVAGMSSGQIMYRTNTTTATTIVGDLTMVRFGANAIGNVQ
jgi:hypothetical protein